MKCRFRGNAFTEPASWASSALLPPVRKSEFERHSGRLRLRIMGRGGKRCLTGGIPSLSHEPYPQKPPPRRSGWGQRWGLQFPLKDHGAKTATWRPMVAEPPSANPATARPRRRSRGLNGGGGIWICENFFSPSEGMAPGRQGVLVKRGMADQDRVFTRARNLCVNRIMYSPDSARRSFRVFQGFLGKFLQPCFT